ncbi:MAG: hypothetical protein RBT75_16020 [Anaerolineae bacterium]|nr:hypothetical protein [Anaerolineae bacterium]
MVTRFRQLVGFRMSSIVPKVIALFVLSILCACSNQSSTDNNNQIITDPSTILTSNPTATQLHPLISATASVELPTLPAVVGTTELPIVLACDSSKLCQLTRSPVSWAQWSTTGDQLFYRLKNSNEFWKFNLENDVATLLSPEQVALFLATPDYMLKVPENIEPHDYAFSPSREKVIYAQKRPLTLPPVLDSDGEGQGPQEIKYDLYVLEMGDEISIHLGYIDGLLDDFIWLPNEQSVLIQTNAQLSGKASIWVANLNSEQLIPLVPVKQGQSEATFEALSLDGDSILYRQSTTLYLKHLTDDSEEEIPIATFGRAYYWFLPTNKLLIVDDFDQPLDFQVAIFDLDTRKLCQISQQILRIHSVELSPNYDYLAIRWAETLELYVLPVYPVCDQEN